MTRWRGGPFLAVLAVAGLLSPACSGGKAPAGGPDAKGDGVSQQPVDGQQPEAMPPPVDGEDGGPPDAPADQVGDGAVPGDVPEDAPADACTATSPAANGVACGCPDDCQSGFCVNGLCCESACTDACFACNLPGKEGACLAAAEGTADKRCPDEGAASCGQDGLCDGNGKCRRYPPGTACAPEACLGDTHMLQRTCDGLGACQDAPSQSCAPFRCGTGGKCATTCGGDADCVPPAVCSGGSCGKKPNGMPCTDVSECASGSCAGGFCCDSACTGSCRSCALPGREGMCTPVAAGTQAADDCKAEAPSTCGRDGTCDGAGGCRLFGASTECAPATCMGSVIESAHHCDGKGACGAPVAVDCAPFLCTAGACRASCSGDGDCVSSAYCDGAGRCQTKLTPGSPCGYAKECASGFCADNVCCASACTGACQTCAATPGTCTTVTSGPDPDTCPAPSSCDTTGACKLPGKMNGADCTVAGDCTSGFCTDGVCCESSCSGICRACNLTGNAGTCQVVTSADDPDTCSGASTCNSVGVCEKKNGEICSAAGECLSGFCKSGTCCPDPAGSTANIILLWDNNTALPPCWDDMSAPGQPFEGKFIRGNSTYGGTGGAASHSHTGGSLAGIADSCVGGDYQISPGVAWSAHTHSQGSISIGSASNIPQYRTLRFIRAPSSTTTLPAGAIALFDAAPPAGWTRYSPEDGNFIQGGAAAGTTGGTATHAHPMSGTSGGPSNIWKWAANSGTNTAYGTTDHTHSVSGTTDASSSSPPYIGTVLAQATADTPIPTGMIAIFDGPPPSSWSVLSAGPGQPFYQVFVYASATYGATGGASSHSHTAWSNGPSPTVTYLNGCGAGTSASKPHPVNIDVATVLPPYLDVVIAKFGG